MFCFLLVHMSGLEPPTPRLSGVCPDRLSYTCIWWTNKDLNLEPIGYEPIALTVVLLVHKCGAQPPREGGLPLEFSAVTPQMVGPRAKPSIDFPLKGDEYL